MHQMEYKRNNKTTKKYSLKRYFIFVLLVSLIAMVFPIGITSVEGNVVSAKAASVKINQTKKTMWVGDTLKLKLLNNKKKVKWTSSKKSVASVSAKGIVKAKKSGKAVITAKVKSKRYKCTVTVRKTAISKSDISLTEGENAALYLMYPKKNVKWTTSDSSIANADGKKVYGVSAGEAVITANCDGKSYICRVVVLPKESDTTLIPKEPETALSADSLTMIYGDSMPLTLNNPKGTVKWTSSDSQIAYANGNVVYGYTVGETVITALCNGSSYSCNVTVVSGETEQFEEDGIYTSKDKVALYIHTYKKLPSNFVTKEYVDIFCGGKFHFMNNQHKCIGGDRYWNYEASLPTKENREYYECDINTLGARGRGTERLVYSNDGLIYYTPDHYNTFVLLYE